MSAKLTAARREAFLRALAVTGNQTIAAARAKVSRSWVSLHRANDPAFRAAMEAAVAAAREAIRARAAEGGSIALAAAGARYQNGAELVVRGTNGRRTQIARARIRQWSPGAEAQFLGVLATCCNVKAACAAVGLTQASAYGHRRRWPDFAQRWDEALEIGYEAVECAMVRAACSEDPWEQNPPDDPAIYGMSSETAMRLLLLHKWEVRGKTGPRPARIGEDRDEAR